MKPRVKKLNLGCGRDYRPGWVNLDINPDFKVDVLHDLRRPLPFKKGEFSLILAADILEHFTKEEGAALLKECWRILKPGGILKIRIPNIEAIIDQFDDDPEVLIHFLYGDTSRIGEFGAHKFGYTRKTLAETLKKLDFEILKMETETTNLICQARKVPPVKPKINLLVIQQSPDIGGAEIFMGGLIKELSRLGVRILAYTNFPKLNQQYQKLGATVGTIPVTLDIIGNLKGLFKTIFLLPGAVFWYFCLIWRLRKKVNLILMSGFSEKLLVTVVASLFGLPVVWLEYGPLASVFKKNFYLPKVLYRLTKRLPKLVIVPSEKTKLSLIKEARVSLAKIRLIPCGVPEKKVRRKGTKKKIVGCLSRLAREKGQEFLLRAAPLVLSEIPEAEFWLIGKGPDEKRLKRLVRRLKIERQVKFLGFVKDKWQVLAQMKVFVFPTVWELEGFGLVTAEAMMVGLPVVATRLGPNPELVDDGRTGLLVEPGDPQELARAIIELLKDEKKAAQLGREGQQRARRFFSLKKTTKEIFQALEEVLKSEG